MIATGLKVRALEAGTVSGDVRIVRRRRSSASRPSRVSGNIEFDAPLSKGGRYEFTSHSGDVRIVLSGSTGFELDADTFSGSVRSDLPVTLRTLGRDDRERGRGRGTSNRAIRGSFGDASAILRSPQPQRLGGHHQEVALRLVGPGPSHSGQDLPCTSLGAVHRELDMAN